MTQGDVIMTQTIQLRSCATLNETGKGLNINKLEIEDNRSLFLSVFDSLNNLYEKLNRLNYMIQKRNIKQI